MTLFTIKEVRNEEFRQLEMSRNLRLGGNVKRPAAEKSLVGLAFSGGGIRSATFNLGILQALAKAKTLRAFDYLSTVSGGGYIGGWLMAWMHHQGIGIKKVEEYLSAHDPSSSRVVERPEVRFLRSYSNYLTPQKGLLGADFWAFAASYLRNALLNQLILVLLLLPILLLPRSIVTLFHILEITENSLQQHYSGPLKDYMYAQYLSTILGIALCGIAVIFMGRNLVIPSVAGSKTYPWFSEQRSGSVSDQRAALSFCGVNHIRSSAFFDRLSYSRSSMDSVAAAGHLFLWRAMGRRIGCANGNLGRETNSRQREPKRLAAPLHGSLGRRDCQLPVSSVLANPHYGKFDTRRTESRYELACAHIRDSCSYHDHAGCRRASYWFDGPPNERCSPRMVGAAGGLVNRLFDRLAFPLSGGVVFALRYRKNRSSLSRSRRSAKIYRNLRVDCLHAVRRVVREEWGHKRSVNGDPLRKKVLNYLARLTPYIFILGLLIALSLLAAEIAHALAGIPGSILRSSEKRRVLSLESAGSLCSLSGRCVAHIVACGCQRVFDSLSLPQPVGALLSGGVG